MISYARHALYPPDTYHRRYDVDVPVIKGQNQQTNEALDLARRVSLTALPFVALYRPAAAVLSMGLGSIRLTTHLAKALQLQKEGDWKGVGSEALVAMCAGASLAASAFHSTTGLFVSTVSDVGFGAFEMMRLGLQGEYVKGAEEGMQALASALYLGFMITGTLEVILLSVLIQAMISLYETKSEWDQGHYIEALGKALLTGLKGYQVNEYRKLIDRRNMLFSLKRYQQLVAQAIKAKTAGRVEGHPLADLEAALQERKVILSAPDQEYDCGAHLHGFGQGAVKGNNLQLRRVNVGGKAVMELEFQLNHVHRAELQKTLQQLSAMDPKEVQDILRLTGSLADSLSVEKEGSAAKWFDFCFSDGTSAPEYRVNMPGLGQVAVGASTVVEGEKVAVPNLYSKVRVRIDEGKSLYDMRELLTFLNLDKALAISSQADIERLKLGHLFRTFYPQEALPIERDKAFFELSFEDLRATMFDKAPGMKEVYDTYFHRMKPAEVVPGKMRYQISGLAEAVSDRGIAYLTNAVTGPQDDEALFSRIANMLGIGVCSSEFRDKNHIQAEGLSRGSDYMRGGADSVFMQLLPKEVLDKDIPFRDFTFYRSRVRMLISLKALELGSYQYLQCGSGNRDLEDPSFYRPKARYNTRLGILDFTDQVAKGDKWYRGHEVMLKERVDPSYLEGLIVSDEKTKEGLIAHLRKSNFVQTNEAGEETILGKLLNSFIRVIPTSDSRWTSGN